VHLTGGRSAQYCDDLPETVAARRRHGCDGGSFGTKPPSEGIDADAEMDVSVLVEYSRGNVTSLREVVTELDGMRNNTMITST
jgi:hypothetical protein